MIKPWPGFAVCLGEGSPAAHQVRPVCQERSQRVPSQCRIRVCPAPVALSSPTAQASEGESALTASRLLAKRPGLGAATRAQLVPFQCSTSVPAGVSPTAHASLLDSALTPVRPLVWLGAGAGYLCP